MKTFESLCQQRRSVRKFTNRPVEDEKIAYMLRCALMSPSAKRTCPWEFIVVRDEAKLRPIATSRTHGAQMFNTATAAIVIALNPTLCHNTWMADGAIAAEHILLAAAEQGVGACWCHVHERENAPALLHQLCAIPDNLEILCVIALGYPDEEKHPYEPDQLKYEKVHKEHF